MITICNYDKYQDFTTTSEQQVNNKRTTSEQQVNINKESKESKEGKEYITANNKIFFTEQCKLAENENSAVAKHYIAYVQMLYGKTKDMGEPFNKLLSLKDPISFERYKQLVDSKIENVERIRAKTISMECDQKIKMISFNKTLTNWFNNTKF